MLAAIYTLFQGEINSADEKLAKLPANIMMCLLDKY
jgi:hypothetical protein